MLHNIKTYRNDAIVLHLKVANFHKRRSRIIAKTFLSEFFGHHCKQSVVPIRIALLVNTNLEKKVENFFASMQLRFLF